MAMPLMPSLSSLSNSSEGLFTGLRPVCCISYIPSSDVEPNLFFIERRMRYMPCLSPSNCITASTMCSSILGPAIEPSLFIWPISITGTPLVLAYFSKALAHSLIWVMLPGADSAISVSIVCIESTTTRSGPISLIWSKTFSKDVSQSTRTSFLRSSWCSGASRNPLTFPFNLSALIFSWCALSSPLTYSTSLSFSAITVCRVSVLLPMPGSPPSNTMLPGTSPPPSTLLSSASCISIRGKSFSGISCRRTADVPPASLNSGCEFSPFEGEPEAVFTSLNVFH